MLLVLRSLACGEQSGRRVARRDRRRRGRRARAQVPHFVRSRVSPAVASLSFARASLLLSHLSFALYLSLYKKCLLFALYDLYLNVRAKF